MMELNRTIGDWKLQVTEADPSLLSCAFAGSAFYRKVREELRGKGELLAGDSQQADKVLSSPRRWPCNLRAAPKDPALTGPACPALGGHADEDGTTGWSLGW